MSGHLSFTIRSEDGHVNNFAGWSKVEELLFHSVKFNEGDYCGNLADYLGHISKQCGHQLPKKKTLGPEGYGLLVADFKEKVIHSLQWQGDVAFRSLTSFSPVMMLSQEDINYWNNLFSLDYVDLYDEKKLIGSVQEVFGSKVNNKVIGDYFIREFTSNEKILFKGESLGGIGLGLKPRGFRNFPIHYYEDTPEGAKLFQKALLDSGFEINKKDQKVWDKFCSEM